MLMKYLVRTKRDSLIGWYSIDQVDNNQVLQECISFTNSQLQSSISLANSVDKIYLPLVLLNVEEDDALLIKLLVFLEPLI